MNTLSGAWCKYTGLNANCWAVYDNDLFFGGTDGVVYQAEHGGTDNGAVIPLRMLPAWSHLGHRGRQKFVTMVKPVFTTDVGVIPDVSIAVDYEEPTSGGVSQDIEAAWLIWDVTEWDDSTSLWYGLGTSSNYRGGGNMGTVVSPYWTLDLDATSSGAEFEFRAIATEVTYMLGSVL